MEITKREIIVSIAIVLITLAFAIWGTIAIVDLSNQKDEVFHKALILESEEAVNHAIESGAGLAFISITINQNENDIATHENLIGSYAYIKENVEEYRSHTRVVTTTDSEGNIHTHTETYYSWDHIETNRKFANQIKLNNYQISAESVEFDFEDLELTEESCKADKYNTHYVIVEGGWFSNRRRCSYDVVRFGSTYSSLVMLEDGEIHPYQGDKISLSNRSVEDLYKASLNKDKLWLILVWFGWLLVTAGLVALFYYADNRWLNKDIGESDE